MGDRVAKDALYDGFAEVAKAMANGRRAELVDVLAQGERHVDDIASEIHQSIASLQLDLKSIDSCAMLLARKDVRALSRKVAHASAERLVHRFAPRCSEYGAVPPRNRRGAPPGRSAGGGLPGTASAPPRPIGDPSRERVPRAADVQPPARATGWRATAKPCGGRR